MLFYSSGAKGPLQMKASLAMRWQKIAGKQELQMCPGGGGWSRATVLSAVRVIRGLYCSAGKNNGGSIA